MLSLMKLVPKSADCQGEGPETLGSFLLVHVRSPENWKLPTALEALQT